MARKRKYVKGRYNIQLDESALKSLHELSKTWRETNRSAMIRRCINTALMVERNRVTWEPAEENE